MPLISTAGLVYARSVTLQLVEDLWLQSAATCLQHWGLLAIVKPLRPDFDPRPYIHTYIHTYIHKYIHAGRACHYKLVRPFIGLQLAFNSSVSRTKSREHANTRSEPFEVESFGVVLGAEYLSPKKVNLLNYTRFI